MTESRGHAVGIILSKYPSLVILTDSWGDNPRNSNYGSWIWNYLVFS